MRNVFSYYFVQLHLLDDVGLYPSLALTAQVRFVRGYSREKDPLAIATEKLTKCLEWRAANNVDRALLSEPANMDEFLSVWPCVLHGQDRDGHPIYYEHIGKVEMDKLQEKFDLGAHLLS